VEPSLVSDPAARVHLATGLLERDGRLLLVASRYPNHPQPLWNLPGGRQRDGELLVETVRREFLEETGLAVEVGSVRYVSESYDRETNVHFLSIAFDVRVASSPLGVRAASNAFADRAADEPFVPAGDAHAVALAWVPFAELGATVTVRVVREPLLTHLADRSRRYFGYGDAGITIAFSDPP
jgi:ADP-ribose pyrophosphatase YjhB (NUDIX family)